MRFKHFFYIIMLFPFVANAQSGYWSNYGAMVSIKDKAYLSVIGDMINSNQGTYHNHDSIFLTGDWTNNAGNNTFINHADSGYVFFYAADQTIRGKDETYFHNLILKTSGVKYATIDAKVDGFLDMTDREFNIDTNTIWVRNNDTASVKRTTGFLSSLKDGGLLRYTTEDKIYLFPVGSNLGISRYRPIELVPASKNANQYKVRFANTDATLEGYDRNNKFHLVCEVNPNWYHRIYHPSGTDSVQIAIFYDPAADGNWVDIAHWQNVPRWEAINRDTILGGTPFSSMVKTRWADFSYAPFALAITSPPFALAGVDTIIWKYDTIQLGASGGVNNNWQPPYNLTCSNCPDPFAFPEQSSIYYLTVADDKGCEDYDSLRILVRDKPFSKFFIPDVITPNGDGINDYWFIRDLERYPDNSVKIVNRWGDEVFSEKPYAQRWRGTWKGNELPGGTYYYLIFVRNSEGQEGKFDGPLTILK